MRKRNLGLTALAFGLLRGNRRAGPASWKQPAAASGHRKGQDFCHQDLASLTAPTSARPTAPNLQLVPGAMPTDDPVQAVEAFVAKNRKEAEEAIDRLTKEAEALCARLEQVEAALVRWTALDKALLETAGQDRGPSGTRAGRRGVPRSAAAAHRGHTAA